MRRTIRAIGRLLGGERRRRPRQNAEKFMVTNRLAELELKLARKRGMTPEQLFDYQNADRILGRRQ